MCQPISNEVYINCLLSPANQGFEVLFVCECLEEVAEEILHKKCLKFFASWDRKRWGDLVALVVNVGVEGLDIKCLEHLLEGFDSFGD